MEGYGEFLLYTIKAISVSYLVFFAVASVICAAVILIKKQFKKLKYLVLLAVLFLGAYAYAVVPRYIDYKNDNYVVLEDVKFGKVYSDLNRSTRFKLPFTDGGYYIRLKDGSTIDVTGLGFFDLEGFDEDEEVDCEFAVYGEKSKQLIEIKRDKTE